MINKLCVILRYLWLKLLKYKETNKKICNTFDHNFKNFPLYVMSDVGHHLETGLQPERCLGVFWV